MDTPIQVDLGRIAQDLQIRRVQVESVVQLLDEGNTVPFITRYRKERTGNLNEVAIHEIQVRVGRLREMAERKQTILKTIEAQGKLTEDLAAAIRGADNPKRLEDLYLPFKPKKKSKASDAREKGLEPLALRIWDRDETLTDLNTSAQEYVVAEKGVETVEAALEGVRHILAEAISEMAAVRDGVRRVVWKTGKIVTAKAEIPEGQGLEYRDYFNYSEPIAHIPPHRVLAINRGDKEGPLKVKLEVSRPDLETAIFSQLPLEGHPQADAFREGALDALDRLLLPSMEREVRRDLTDLAERHAVDVFARNLRSLLLQPPIPKQVVLAIDPGFRTGCKVAVLDPNGNLLEHGVIHPHPPQNRRSEAKLYLKDLVGRHQIGVVAIGNQSACRETEELIAEIIAEGTYFHQNPGATDYKPAGNGNGQTTPAASPPEHDEHSEPAHDEHSEPAPPEAEAEAEAEATAEEAPSAPAYAAMPETATTPETSPTIEAPAEPLPPISGGSPEASSETEAETAPADAPAETQPQPPEAESPKHDPLVAGDHATPPAPEAGSAPAPEPMVVDAPGPETEQGSPSLGEPVAGPSAHETTGAPAEEVPGVTPPPPPDTVTPGESTNDSAATGSTPEASPEASPEATGGPASPPVPVSRPARSEHPRPPKPKPAPMPPRPHSADALLTQLAYVIVNEAGASVYSASPVGREEFPEFDATLRGTVSIGRRLQDPLAELVKIEPQSIGVGLYQHDINSKQLKESLESVISSCVNFVGVDLNTASVPLLRHVSGLNQLTARRVVEHRKEKGPFANRAQITDVEGIGPATFTQAAGFLKVPGGEHPLDRTWVHPESYEVATRLLEKLEFTPEAVRDKEQLAALREKLEQADLPALAHELEVGEPTLFDIFEALARPERDPRDDLPKPIFKKGVLKLEDLAPGMELKGTVLNVVDFGAFVDIGLKDSGLVHISQLANRYIKSPHDVVSVGDVVTAWVMGVDHERKRVSLTMVKPGTERPRGAPGGGGGRRGGPEARAGGGGGERRGGGGPQSARPPRQGSGLSPQPAGTAPSGTPGEGPPRRPDRPAGRGPEGPGGGPRQGQGPGRGPGGGRFGGRSGGPGSGGGPGGRPPERPQPPRPPAKPKPTVPQTPLSEDALKGSVPLRTFGQLKQLWQAREEPGPETPPAAESSPSPEPAPPPTPEPGHEPTDSGGSA